jgi:hypothetical protein
MWQYSYNLINGYPVASIGAEKFLIDTALPFSVAQQPIFIAGERFEAASEVMGVTASAMNAAVGIKLDGILGGNVTDRFVIKIRPLEHKVLFDQYLDDYPLEMDIQNLGGTAIMHQTIAGKQLKAFLALGNRLSYVHPELVEGLTPVGLERDVLGMLGEIQTEVYSLPVSLGRTTHMFRFGVTPEPLLEVMAMANVTASLGSELLEHYALTLAIDEGVLMLDPLGPTTH